MAAARAAAAVAQQADFITISLPRFDVPALNRVLARALPDLEENTTALLQAHFAAIGDGGEGWVEDGVMRLHAEPARLGNDCPFCAQDLGGSRLIQHYQAYFGAGYQQLKDDISLAEDAVTDAHSGDVKSAFERSVRIAGERREFWSRFANMPEIGLDTAAIMRLWNAAYAAVRAALRAKSERPLEPQVFPVAGEAAVLAYHEACDTVSAVSDRLVGTNEMIRLTKERAAAANVPALQADLAALQRLEARFEAVMDQVCTAIAAEKAAKATTEKQRNTARDALTTYRSRVFPAYQTAINTYLQRFNAGFRIGNVASVNTRSGSTANYAVVIDQVVVPLVPANDGEPGFRNTLSAGDRNTLALAFFFAALEQDLAIAQKIVVIDDPMTSLDEHRSLATVQELRRLVATVQQVIILSHSKPFLCSVWEGADRTARAAMKVARSNPGSTFVAWDVNQDCISEHDKRHELVSRYVQNSVGMDERSVAAALRPILEAFIRVAYPASFPPGALLGPFVELCRRRIGTPTEILNQRDVAELRDLLDYANLFHHETNPAWETQAINDQQLLDFCNRTLAFTRR